MTPTPDLLPAIPALILAATGLLVLLAQAFARHADMTFTLEWSTEG
jgi:hypothetical protein